MAHVFLYVVAATSFILAGVAILVLCLLLPTPFSEKPNFYPDLITQEASTCWEATVFATNNDPIYKWVQSSSLANTFNAFTIDAERATAAYQRATIWRSASMESESKSEDIKLFNAPEPRILAGVIREHRTNWICKMQLSWGLGVRVCLERPPLPGQLVRAEDDSVTCTWTAPAVYDQNNNLGVLMVKVPYGMPTPDPFKTDFPSYGNHGSFLMNFAGNARRNVSIGVGRKRVRADSHDHDWFKYQIAVPECPKSAPVMFVPDIASYMAFPFLQCACEPSTRVCIVGQNITKRSQRVQRVGPFVLSDEKCETTKSFWNWDLRRLDDQLLNGSMIPLSSYSRKLDTFVAVGVKFKYRAFPAVNDTTIGLMNRITQCIEDWLERQVRKPEPGKDGPRLLKECGPGVSPLIELNAFLNDNVFARVEVMMDPGEIRDIVYTRVTSLQNAAAVTCGIEEGQASANLELCLIMDYTLPGLAEQLESFAKVSDIRRFERDLWKKGSSKRWEVYLGILSTLLTLAITIVGSLSNQLQDGEQLVFKHVRVFKGIMKLPALRTLFRASIILITTGTCMFPLFQSIKDIKMEPTQATSGTIPQRSPTSLVFLVTTTSTVEVFPNWIVFSVFTVLLAAFIITATAFIYNYMVQISNEASTGDEASQAAAQYKR